MIVSIFKTVYASSVPTQGKTLLKKPHFVYAVRNMAKLIDGKVIAEEIRAELRQEIEEYVQQGNRVPHLTAILVGDNPASRTYILNKMKACEDVGISSMTKKLPESTTQEELLELINEMNESDEIDGLLVQLPVPDHMDERTVCNAVCYKKDVDGFNILNVGRLALGMEAMVPATSAGVLELIRRSCIETFGKNAVVISRSKNVGMPLALMMHSDKNFTEHGMDASVTICHRYTPPKELKKYCLNADIIITATGVPKLIRKDMVKPGACIIDVGITRVKDEETGKSKIVGDVDFEEVRQVAGHITPVPGGVGPMTVTMLLRNTIVAAKSMNAERKQSE